MRIVKPSVSLEWITPNAEKVIEHAGRTCYKSEARITGVSAYNFIKKILKSGHESVIEHAAASFRIICDRGITHEIVRHRLASYSQESTRYCNYSKDKHGNEIRVIEPPFKEFRGGGSDTDATIWQQQWTDIVSRIEAAYLGMVESGCPPQLARSVLPNCLKTEIVMTANFREWRHFIKLRTSAAAHPQIREIARPILLELIGHAPAVFTDLFDD